MKYLKLFEFFNSRQDAFKWLYDNKILDSDEQLDPIGSKKLITYFIKKHPDTIIKTALRNCHAIGLNSFLLSIDPKIRLFVCDRDTELKSYDPKNPTIPIHPHKYDDLFFQIRGNLHHHLYKKDSNGIPFNKYNFIRLDKIDTEIQNLGKENLKYIGEFSNINQLKAKTLHTVSVKGDDCSWIIIETKRDETFDEIFYHQNLTKNTNLYKPFEDPIGFLTRFVNNI